MLFLVQSLGYLIQGQIVDHLPAHPPSHLKHLNLAVEPLVSQERGAGLRLWFLDLFVRRVDGGSHEPAAWAAL